MNWTDTELTSLHEQRPDLQGRERLMRGGGYTFMQSGLPAEERRLHGVAFAVRTSLLRSIPESTRRVNERIMVWRLPFCNGAYLSIICIYAPTLVAENILKDRFSQQLGEAARGVHRGDKLVVHGDLNARVGSDQQALEVVLGAHGVGRCNGNGLRLLSFCVENKLVVTNTIFKLSNKHKTTWKHPRSGQWHMLDYVLVRQRDRRDINITRAVCGADGWTDNNFVRTRLLLRIRPPVRQTGTATTNKLDARKLWDATKRAILQNELDECMRIVLGGNRDITTDFLTEEWSRVAGVMVGVMVECAGRVLGERRSVNKIGLTNRERTCKF